MSPYAVIFNIAIITAIIGIIVYWVQRFAVFRGYKAIESEIYAVANRLDTKPVREAGDVLLAGTYSRIPTVVRFSHRLDRPGLYMQMRVPATFGLVVMPKTEKRPIEGRVLMRTGSQLVDARFNARSNDPVEVRMLLAGADARQALEKLCCSSQTGISIRGQLMELSELTIPSFPAKHVMEHLDGMAELGRRIQEMPGATAVKIEPWPRPANSITIRVALALGLIALVALLFAQPYSRPAASGPTTVPTAASGVDPVDASRILHLAGWHAASAYDLHGGGVTYLRAQGAPVTGHIRADFSGSGTMQDSAYLLLDQNGRPRITVLAAGRLFYDAKFPRVDALARIPKATLAKIQWTSFPQFTADGDGLLVIQNADDPTASLVLLKHGLQIYSAHPADFNQIELSSQ
ncbi:MAG TPA: hypothetical protein VHN74_19755 [Candidatus Angelobacter sp.]|jgi:hypothetical protein|nr:hypothetical protein [Candidatus Angelobacter sp.]